MAGIEVSSRDLRNGRRRVVEFDGQVTEEGERSNPVVRVVTIGPQGGRYIEFEGTPFDAGARAAELMRGADAAEEWARGKGVAPDG